MTTEKIVHVVVAVICRAEQCFIAKRPKDVHQGGLWEFPGGKCEEGEDLERALSRELMEECGIAVSRFTKLMTIEHNYPDKAVSLSIFEVDSFQGEPSGCEGQETRWAPIVELPDYEFPEANKSIVEFLVRRQVQGS